MTGEPRDMLMLTAGGAARASTRYRALALVPALEKAGYRTRVRFPVRLATSGPMRRLGRIVDLGRDLLPTGGTGLWWIQRKVYPASLASRLRRSGRTIVFDLDDAIDLPPPRLPSRDDPAVRARYRERFAATVANADLVLCGNAELASRVPHERTAIVPTAIDTARFFPGALAAPAPPRTLGWVGHADNLPYLESLAGPLVELRRRWPDLRLVVVADRPPRLDGIDVEFRRWSLDAEVKGFSGIGVGLMPLADTPWARGKCAFKAIQYMALGIPTVASPVGANAELIEDGESGLLAQRPEDWVVAIDRLFRDAELARRIAEAGRREVLERYSLDVVSGRVVALVDDLLASLTSSSSSRAHSSA